MTNDAPWFEQVSIPALLRHARTTYGRAMRGSLAEAGCDDLPGNGLYVIGALARQNSALARIIAELGMSKQAAGQLVDTLVLRGYLERSVDMTDRRRLNVALTERGRAAAAAQAVGRDAVDRKLEARIGLAEVATMRRALASLIEIGRAAGDGSTDQDTES